METFKKICREIPYLVKISQKVSGGVREYISTYCSQQYEILCSATAVQKETILAFRWQHSKFAIADDYIKSTIHWKSIVAFPWQTVVTRTRRMLRCMHIAYVSCQYIAMGLRRQLVPRGGGVNNCSTQHGTL
jgi:hypothetical protein